MTLFTAVFTLLALLPRRWSGTESTGAELTVNASWDDIQLVTAIAARNAKAIEVIYDRYSALVYKIAMRILQAEDAAADLTQEVFLSLWNRPDRFDSNRGSLAVFLSVMTRSQSLNRIRQRQSQERLVQRLGQITLGPMTMANSTESRPFDQAALGELRERVCFALQQLPEQQRQVLEMAYYEGLSQSDITERTGIPLGTVKSRSRQGLLKLRDLLKDLAE
jgi:RNA polymerase sigma-70 factor, ECF subfamily